MAVFAGAFTFGTVFTIPANGQLPCNNNCDAVRTLLAIAFICFANSLFLTIFVQIVLRNEESTKPPEGNVKQIIIQVAIIICAIGLIGGFVLLSVVLILSNQRVAGGVTIAIVVISGGIVTSWWLYEVWMEYAILRRVIDGLKELGKMTDI